MLLSHVSVRSRENSNFEAIEIEDSFIDMVFVRRVYGPDSGGICVSELMPCSDQEYTVLV